MLSESKLNSIETLASKALIGMEISHEEFTAIIYERIKQKVRNANEHSSAEKQEIMRPKSVNSKK